MEGRLDKFYEVYPYIVDKIPDGIYIISPEGFQYVNAAFKEITGLKCESPESIANEFIKHVHPDDRGILENRRNLGRSGRNEDLSPLFEIRWICDDGTIRHFEFNTRLLPGLGNHVLGIVQDITERRMEKDALRESASMNITLIENANDAVVVIQDGLIKLANPFLLKASGYALEDLLDKPFVNFVDAGDLDRVVDLNRRRSAGEQVDSSYEVVLKTNGPKRLTVETNVSPITYGGGPAFFAVLHDVTKRKELQKQLEGTLEKLRTALGATTQAITLIVEQRDPYTAGHQRRVADLARAIAAELELPMERIDSVRMGGLLHDLGKISVPSEILSKPTTLTEAEFSLMKTHPRVAYDILKTIDFPWPIATIILEHHERLDGSGYPQGLGGDDILLEARILAVADVVEAMISHRPYRPARTLEEALSEISRNKGRLYDPEIVDACVRVFRQRGFSFRPPGPSDPAFLQSPE
jgi:PAS domain S-box-containing protein/putative nucleotidyltransferase with HDIG domain